MRSQRSGVLTTRRIEEIVCQGAGNDSVGGDHEIFDQLGGAILLLLDDVGDLVVDEHGTDFDGFDIERAMPVALLLERLRDGVLQFELRLQVGGGRNFRRRGAVPSSQAADRRCR